MADKTGIEWTDATWNPITGCAVVSPGCKRCYAMKLAGTRLRHIPSRAGLTRDSQAGPVWTGEVRLNEQWLDQPLRWQRPRKIFVCAHGDLFAENVPDAWIDRVFAVMALAPQHTFQVLTKRAARMRHYVRNLPNRDDLVASAAVHMWGGRDPDGVHETVMHAVRNPLPNVWLGVSAEDQQRADERVPELLATPAAIRFVSAEPLLGPIDFTCVPRPKAWPTPTDDIADGIDALRYLHRPHPEALGAAEPRSIDWIIAGGESGAGARPMHPAWVREIRDDCAAAGVAFLFKQWGAFRPLTPAEQNTACGATLIGSDRYDRDAYVLRVGKKRAGRLLDGAEHNAFPEVPA